MGHARNTLQEIWRVLAPGGLLLDLRPVASAPQVEIINGERVLRAGRLDDSHRVQDDRTAADSLEHLVQAGWYARKRTGSFRFALYWDNPPAMKTYIEENWSEGEKVVPPAVFTRAQKLMSQTENDARVRVRLKLLIAVYQKLPR